MGVVWYMTLYIFSFTKISFTEYSNPHCTSLSSCWNSSSCVVGQAIADNFTHDQVPDVSVCSREGGISYAVISLGTVWIGVALYNFRKRSVATGYYLHLHERSAGTFVYDSNKLVFPYI